MNESTNQQRASLCNLNCGDPDRIEPQKTKAKADAALIKASTKLKVIAVDQDCGAVLYSHTWGVSVPDYIGLISDELLLNPWDREIFVEGEFQFHPEYIGALKQQGYAVEPSLALGSS